MLIFWGMEGFNFCQQLRSGDESSAAAVRTGCLNIFVVFKTVILANAGMDLQDRHPG
jgi:hypothetical protein